MFLFRLKMTEKQDTATWSKSRPELDNISNTIRKMVGASSSEGEDFSSYRLLCLWTKCN